MSGIHGVLKVEFHNYYIREEGRSREYDLQWAKIAKQSELFRQINSFPKKKCFKLLFKNGEFATSSDS